MRTAAPVFSPQHERDHELPSVEEPLRTLIAIGMCAVVLTTVTALSAGMLLCLPFLPGYSDGR